MGPYPREAAGEVLENRSRTCRSLESLGFQPFAFFLRQGFVRTVRLEVDAFLTRLSLGFLSQRKDVFVRGGCVRVSTGRKRSTRFLPRHLL
jgi:hypothetical protein